LARGERGSAPVLAVFTIFTLLSCTLAISSFQASDQRSVSATQQLVAADVTRATASTVEGELTQALYTAVTAAMYEAGSAGEEREDVERLTLEYLNRRISHSWSYPNLVVNISEADNDDLKFEWQPDGSVRVWGYLGAEVKHVYGPTAHGIKLEASLNPRFERLKGVAELGSSSAASAQDLEALEGELNERYAAEGLAIELREDNGYVDAIVSDVFAAPCAVVGGNMELVRYTASSPREIVLPPPAEESPSPPQPSPPPNPPELEAQGDFTLDISPPSGSPTPELGRVEVEVGPIEVSLQGGEGISILTVLDGGSATQGYFVLPGQFLPSPNTFVRPEDPELAELFALQGYIDYSTGEVKPLLPGELPGIEFEKLPSSSRQ